MPSPARPSYLAQYNSDSGLILLNAGTAHGVTLEAEFDFYPTYDLHPFGDPLRTFVVDNSASFFSTLKPANDAPFDSIPTDFTVFQAKPGKDLHPDHSSACLIRDIRRLLHNAKFVNSPNDAQMELAV